MADVSTSCEIFTIDDSFAHLRNGNFQALETLFGVTKQERPVDRITTETQKYADIAVALQVATEEIFIKLAKQIREETGSRHLLSTDIQNCTRIAS